MRTALRLASLGGAALALAGSLGAQAATSPAAPPVKLAVGSMAPDFTLPGATRYGLLSNKVHLADYRGQTVVIAFFYKARTKG